MEDTTELKVKGFAWGPNHGSLAVVVFEPTTFWSVAQNPP